MQICETCSYTTEDQPASPLSPSTLPEYNDLSGRLDRNMQMLMRCLGDLSIISPSSPISTAIPFDKVFVKIERCQQNLIWNLPDDIWTDDIEAWIFEIPYFAVEVHPAPTAHATKISQSSNSSNTSSERWIRMFPSFELPHFDLFTDRYWQEHVEQYSPSIYSQDEYGISHPFGAAAQQIQQEAAETPMHQSSIQKILVIIPKMQQVCAEILKTTHTAEDSTGINGDTDSNSDISMLDINSDTDSNSDIAMLDLNSGTDSNSDVSMLDLNTMPSPPPTNFYELARSLRLTTGIPTSSPPSRYGDLPSPAPQPISRGIHNRLSALAASRGLTVRIPAPACDCAP